MHHALSRDVTPHALSASAIESISSTVVMAMLGTIVAADETLMSAGIDSLQASEFVNTL